MGSSDRRAARRGGGPAACGAKAARHRPTAGAHPPPIPRPAHPARYEDVGSPTVRLGHAAYRDGMAVIRGRHQAGWEARAAVSPRSPCSGSCSAITTPPPCSADASDDDPFSVRALAVQRLPEKASGAAAARKKEGLVRPWHVILAVLVLVVVGPPVFLYLALRGGHPERPGSVHPTPLPSVAIHDRRARQQAVTERGTHQILFGDLHVHTTFSVDAFQLSLPIVRGGRASTRRRLRLRPLLLRPRLLRHHRSRRDLTPNPLDRGEAHHPAVQRRRRPAGESPDVVAFVGWEWSQAGAVPEEHYGHRTSSTWTSTTAGSRSGQIAARAGTRARSATASSAISRSGSGCGSRCSISRTGGATSTWGHAGGEPRRSRLPARRRRAACRPSATRTADTPQEL